MRTHELARPYLSVVVPCYRSQAVIRTCVDSVLAYQGPGVELVAVDDASPDGTAAILHHYAARDPRVRVVPLRVNGGLGAARTAGLAAAAGEYLWFIDSDDWLPDQAVDAVLSRLQQTRPDVLIVDHYDVFDQLRVPRRAASVIGPTRSPLRLVDRPEMLRLAQSACTKIVRRNFLAAPGLGFPNGWYEDAYYGRAVLLAAERIDVLDQLVYCYRQQTPGSITNTPSARHLEVFDQYTRLWEFAGNVGGAVRAELFRAMIDHYLVILGHDLRLPAALRRDFFRRVVVDFHRWRPDHGFRFPAGPSGLKYRLVNAGVYPAYAALRLAYRVVLAGRRP